MEAETCFLWCNVEFVFLKWTSLDWKLVDSRFRNFIIQRWRWDSKTRTMIDKRSSNILARVYNVELWSQGSYEAQPCFKSLTLLSHCKLYNAGLPSRIVPLASLSSTFSSMSHYFQESDLVDIDSMSSGGFKSDDAIRSNISPLKRGKACAVCRSVIVLPCLLLVFLTYLRLHRAHKIVCYPLLLPRWYLNVVSFQRCDGVRPICGSCRRKPKADACDWDNSQSKSKVATLEETIETLKARIFELEHPELVTPSVTLHYPYRRDEEESFSHRSTSFDTQSSCPNPSFPSSDSYWDTTTPTTTTGISSMTSINGESITGGSMEFEYTRTAFPRQDASRCMFSLVPLSPCV